MLVEDTVRDSMTKHDAERFDKATTLVGEYIRLLGAYVQGGAKVTLPRPVAVAEQAD